MQNWTKMCGSWVSTYVLLLQKIHLLHVKDIAPTNGNVSYGDLGSQTAKGALWHPFSYRILGVAGKNMLLYGCTNSNV